MIITGASRGIGAAIAKSFAKRGAQIALIGRSNSKPSHSSLEGTLVETARDVEKLSGKPLIVPVDISDGFEWKKALTNVLDSWDGVDVLINNASVLSLEKQASLKNLNLLYNVNTRATMIAIQTCLPYMKNGGSIVTLSPPIRLGRLDWISQHPSYTISKYSMSLATLGAASETVRANCIWPKRMIATAATKRIENIIPGSYTKGRDPNYVAESVYKLSVEMECNAKCLMDEDVLDAPVCESPFDAFVEEGTHWNGLGC